MGSKAVDLHDDILKWQSYSESPNLWGHIFTQLTFRVGGVSRSMQLDAIEVPSDEDMLGGNQCARNPEWQDEFDALSALTNGSDGPFETFTISGKEYVIFMTPFCT